MCWPMCAHSELRPVGNREHESDGHLLSQVGVKKVEVQHEVRDTEGET